MRASRKIFGLTLCFCVLIGYDSFAGYYEDSIEVEILNSKAWANRRVQVDSAKIYARMAVLISKKTGLKTSLATAYNRLGFVLFCENENLDSAEYFLNKALDLRRRYASNKEVAAVINNLALVAKSRLDYSKAVEHYQSALEILDPDKDADLVVMIKGNLATTLSYTGEYAKSLQLFLRNLAYVEMRGDSSRWATTSLDLSNTYGKLLDFDAKLKHARKAYFLFVSMGNEIGEIKSRIALGSALMELGNLDSAKTNLKRAHDLAAEYDLSNLQAKAIGNLAKVDRYQGNIFDAVVKNRQALLLLSAESSAERALILLDLGILHMESGKRVEAMQSYKEAFRLVQGQMPLRTLEVARQLEQLYASMGNIDSAFFYSSVIRSISDTLMAQTRKSFLLEKRLAEQRAAEKLLLSEQKLKNENDQKKRMKLYVLFITVISLLIIVFMWYRISQKKKILTQRNELLAKEKELLKQEKAMRHQDKVIRDKELEVQKGKINELLKNQELSSIMNVLEVQEKERRRIAQDLHDRLGSTLSMVKLHFKNSEKNLEKLQQQNKDEYQKANRLLDDACDEVRKIAHNLISGVLRKFGLVAALSDLKQTIEQSGQLDMEVLTTGLDQRLGWDYELNLYRIIQELLANTMKHAVATEVSIQLLRNNGNLNMVYQDNGRGFSPEKVTYGLGLKNIESRLDKLNGKMEIDTGKGGGSTFTFDVMINVDEENKGFTS